MAAASEYAYSIRRKQNSATYEYGRVSLGNDCGSQYCLKPMHSGGFLGFSVTDKIAFPHSDLRIEDSSHR